MPVLDAATRSPTRTDQRTLYSGAAQRQIRMIAKARLPFFFSRRLGRMSSTATIVGGIARTKEVEKVKRPAAIMMANCVHRNQSRRARVRTANHRAAGHNAK